MLKSEGVECACASSYVVVAYSILVSAPVPLELFGSWLGLGLRGFVTELDKNYQSDILFRGSGSWNM